VVSKRRRAQQAGARRAGPADARLAKRVTQLERRYDRLVTGLDRLVKQAKRPR
jgi:hypothetical protein